MIPNNTNFSYSGELKIAEVKSRFENLEKFIEFMKLYFGFELVNMVN
jgi:hypothetical protein